jgi:hypothetical protein
MKKILFGIITFLLISCQETIKKTTPIPVPTLAPTVDVAKRISANSISLIGKDFVLGDGLRGSGISFHKDKKFTKYGFSDIGPISTECKGTFSNKDSCLIIEETTCYYTSAIKSLFNEVPQVLELSTDTFYIWQFDCEIFLKNTSYQSNPSEAPNLRLAYKPKSYKFKPLLFTK